MWSITKNVPTMALPLMFILGVAAIKEILEDMEDCLLAKLLLLFEDLILGMPEPDRYVLAPEG